MTANEHKATRALSPVQLRAIALRVQGLDITDIAREVGRDRTTVSRWFTTDPLVIEELDRRVEDQYETELAQHANLRKKAMGVVEGALDGGGRQGSVDDPSPQPDAEWSRTGREGHLVVAALLLRRRAGARRTGRPRGAPSGARGHEPVAGPRA